MAGSPRYGDLRVDGEALQRRLGEIIVSVDLVEALVSDLRAWQLRCLTTVAARTPMAVDAFRVETGSTQRLLGEGWLPKPGWQAEMNQSIDDRLHALERVRRLERDDRRSSRQDG